MGNGYCCCSDHVNEKDEIRQKDEIMADADLS